MIQRTLLALCDPTRREIIKILKRGEKTVGEINERFDISPPAISRHLCVLRDAELVQCRREGKFIYYSLDTDKIEGLLDWLRELLNDYQ
jgi:DNA-binding transcriptional ArsR family regulator